MEWLFLLPLGWLTIGMVAACIHAWVIDKSFYTQTDWLVLGFVVVAWPVWLGLLLYYLMFGE